MNPARFAAITQKYAALRIAIVGDFTLDRYLEIDPARRETSIETGLAVHNVANIRSLPGSAGTILNNLVALGVGTIHPVGICGEDGEGYELQRALKACRGVTIDHFVQTNQRRTFTYCKPLVIEAGKAPRELNRLDTKNWTPTPAEVENNLIECITKLAPQVNALILLDQVDMADTGVVTKRILAHIEKIAQQYPDLIVSADSRRGLNGFPAIIYKMNAAELSALTGMPLGSDLAKIQQTALALSQRNRKIVFITLAERGMLAAAPNGEAQHVEAMPLRGEIDVVGAGDAVTANLISALSAGAGLREALELATAAASIVIHQLGTTGTASVEQLRPLCAAL